MNFGMTNIIGELGVKITGYTKGLSNSLKDATKELNTFGKNTELTSKVTKLALTGLATAAAGITAGLALSAKSAVHFEKGMGNVSTLVDTAQESMKEMGKEVLNISKITPVSLDDLTSSLYDIRSAGISASDAMSVLEQSAKLGVSGLGTTKEATDLVTSSLNAFKLSGKESDKVYGLIFNTVKSGKTTISELAQGFGAVAGTVANANIELPEYLSAVAALTTTGLPAAQAHTQLKAAIAGVTRDSKELKTILDTLGSKSFKDLVKNEGGMVNAFKKITKEVKGNDAAILKLFGSTEAYNAVIQLSGELNGSFTDTLLSMQQGTENLTEAFNKQNQTVSAQWQTMKNNLNALSIQVGSALLPALNQGLTSIIQFIDKIPEVVNKFKEWVAHNDMIQGALIAFGSILTGLAITTLPPLITALGTLIATIATASAPFIAMGGIITGMYVTFKNWETILLIVTESWNNVATATKNTWEWIQSYLQTTLQRIAAIFTKSLGAMVADILQHWNNVTNITSETWERMKKTTEILWNSIATFFSTLWTRIKSVFFLGLETVQHNWSGTWMFLQEFTISIWENITNSISNGIFAIKDIFDGATTLLGNAWQAIWSNLSNILSGVFQTIKDKVSGVISWIQKALDKINIFKSKREEAQVGGFHGGGYTFGSTGKIAGVVHGGEWVAPSWMVGKYQNLITQLETIRTRGYELGGFVSGNTHTNYNNQRSVTQNITQNINDTVDFSIAAREMGWRARFC